MDNPQLTPAIGSGFALMAPLDEPVRDARVTAAVVEMIAMQRTPVMLPAQDERIAAQ